MRSPWGDARGDRTRKLSWAQWEALLGQIERKEIGITEASRVYKVARLTIYRKMWRLKRYCDPTPRRFDPVRAFMREDIPQTNKEKQL